MTDNILVLNTEKMTIVVLHNDPMIRSQFQVQQGTKTLYHTDTIKVLGIQMSWDGSGNRQLIQGSESVKSKIYQQIKEI